MKKKLMEALKTKFPGVDDAILDRIATKRGEAITDEAEIPAIVEGIGFQDVLTSYGDFRAGNAASSAVSSYEKKHNLKDGKTITPDPNEEGGPKPPTPTDLSATITAAVSAAVKPLQEKIEAFESGERNKSFVAGLKEKLNGVDESFYAHSMEGRTFGSQEEVDAFAAKITESWEEFTKKHASEGLSFSAVGKSGGDTADEIGDIVKIIETETKDRTQK